MVCPTCETLKHQTNQNENVFFLDRRGSFVRRSFHADGRLRVGVRLGEGEAVQHDRH